MTEKDPTLIPEGDYCYSRDPYDLDIKYDCPYWREIKPTTHDMVDGKKRGCHPGIGHCDFLGKSDTDFKLEGREHSLLWDQVKECGIATPPQLRLYAKAMTEHAKRVAHEKEHPGTFSRIELQAPPDPHKGRLITIASYCGGEKDKKKDD